jgi:hypothetical protein
VGRLHGFEKACVGIGLLAFARRDEASACPLSAIVLFRNCDAGTRDALLRRREVLGEAFTE